MKEYLYDAEILAASMRAKAKLNKLRKEFNKGLEPGEFILLKAPFKMNTGIIKNQVFM